MIKREYKQIKDKYDKTNWQLEDYLFRGILIMAQLLSVFSIIINSIIGYPFDINYKWFFIIIFSCLILYKMKCYPLIKKLRIIYFIILSFIIIPYGWFESGGSFVTISYVFFAMICFIFFFQGWLRNFCVIFLIFLFIIFLYIQELYPNLLVVFDTSLQFYDIIGQAILTLFGGFILLKKFADAYRDEKDKLNLYSLKLQQVNKQLEFMSNRDELTKVYNRRKFNLKLDEILLNNTNESQECYLVLLDIDYFKKINDSYGHSVGDDVICHVARTLVNIMPKDSMVSRWGGDEFTIIYFGTINNLEYHMKALYQSINEVKLIENHPITLSSGITLIHKNDKEHEVFKRVDQALYHTKNNGRNKYTILID